MSDSSDEEQKEEAASSGDPDAKSPKDIQNKPKITASGIDEATTESLLKRPRTEEDSDEETNEEPQQKVKPFGASDRLQKLFR